MYHSNEVLTARKMTWLLLAHPKLFCLEQHHFMTTIHQNMHQRDSRSPPETNEPTTIVLMAGSTRGV